MNHDLEAHFRIYRIPAVSIRKLTQGSHAQRDMESFVSGHYLAAVYE